MDTHLLGHLGYDRTEFPESDQTDLSERLAQQPVLVAGRHDDLCVEHRGDGERFSREQVQPPAGAIELIGHYGRHLSPAQHANLVGQFEDRLERPLTLHWWQREHWPRQRATCTSHHGLAEAQVPVAGREHLSVGPIALLPEQGRQRLVVDEEGQRSARATGSPALDPRTPLVPPSNRRG
jgi:hypothetical protein